MKEDINHILARTKSMKFLVCYKNYSRYGKINLRSDKCHNITEI